MAEMGFNLLMLFGCYFLFKEGEISWIRVGMSQERLERVGVGSFCKPVGIL
jgi:hypothetical protein